MFVLCGGMVLPTLLLDQHSGGPMNAGDSSKNACFESRHFISVGKHHHRKI